MSRAPEWDTTPTTIGQAVLWFEEADKHLGEGPDMVEYISHRWLYIIDTLAQEQGVRPGWLAYMISTLVVEDGLDEAARATAS